MADLRNPARGGRDAGTGDARTAINGRHAEDASVAIPFNASILVVDDHPDIRRMLVTALELEGYHVDEADGPEAGLRRLAESRYNLVLSDYAMPGGTGTWMVHEATRRGLMDHTAALIVTAHPDVDGDGIEVVAKPLDLDRFLGQVRRLLRDAALNQGRERGQHVTSSRYRVELVLYISSSSSASLRARRVMERVLESFEEAQVKYTVCDLVQDPGAGDVDRVAFTPTLVKRFPEPRVWILGNLRDSRIVTDMLHTCGVDEKA